MNTMEQQIKESLLDINSEALGPTLGSGTNMLDSELLTADIEDEYDALNDETFGDSLHGQDDWEGDHEQLIHLEEETSFADVSLRSSINSFVRPEKTLEDLLFTAQLNNTFQVSATANNVTSYSDDSVFERSAMPAPTVDMFVNTDEALEESLNKLVLEDDLDDPAIMNMSRSKPVSMAHAAICRRSPPPPAIFESDNVGSPSTSSIWTPPHVRDNSSGDAAFSLLFSNMKKRPTDFQTLDDPSIVGIGKDIRKKSLPSEIFHNAKTVDEIERDLLNMNDKPTRQLNSIEADQSRLITIIPKDQHESNNVQRYSQIRKNTYMINQDSDSSTAWSSLSDISPIRNISSPANNHAREPGCAVSPPLFGIQSSTSSPYTTPKVSLNSYLGQPYLNRMIPPQVGFNRPLLVQPRAFLGHPLRFPTAAPPINRAAVAGLVSLPQSHFFAPQPMYFDNRFPRPVPPHLYPQQNLIRACGLKRPDLRFPYAVPYIPYEEEDEYANLMTQKEKDWLVKIQMMQLQSNNPYEHDYYYTMYTMKKKIEEQNKQGGDRTHEPKLVVPETSRIETRTYKPAQYEGSLGKLQAISVNFPRKIIDLESMHPEDASTEPTCNKDLRKLRQILLEIENMYRKFLTIDDLEKKMAALPRDSCQKMEDEKQGKIVSIYSKLLKAVEVDDFIQIMTIRKGRDFVCRALPLLPLDEKLHILNAIINNWNAIMKKLHDDEVLHRFEVHFVDTISNTDCMRKLLPMGRTLQKNAMDLTQRLESITIKKFGPALLQKLGIGIACNLLSRAEILRHLNLEEKNEEEVDSEWKSFVCYVAELWGLSSDVPSIDAVLLPLMCRHFERHVNDEKTLDLIKKKLHAVQKVDSSGDPPS